MPPKIIRFSRTLFVCVFGMSENIFVLIAANRIITFIPVLANLFPYKLRAAKFHWFIIDVAEFRHDFRNHELFCKLSNGQVVNA